MHVDGIEALPEEWARAAAVISDGGVVAVPTDTVYGLACDPRSSGAVERIYELKRRPAALELNLLAAARADLEPLVEFGEDAAALAERFWPGGLALVVPVRAPQHRVLAVPRSGITLMVRVPGHGGLLGMLGHTGPVASTSANRHGEPPALTPEEVTAALGNEVDLVVPGDAGAERTASTIVDCSMHPPRILREGAVAAAAVAAATAPGEQPL